MMAIFQFQMQVIGRSEGRSVVSAAAYRAAEKIENTYTGLTEDYSKKEWVVYKEVLLPENAPPQYQDRAALWNAVEQAEKGKNARLAREIEVALPLELSMEENIALIRSFASDTLQADGMAVDLCVHNPPRKDKDGFFVDHDGNRVTRKEDLVFGNPHAHLLFTVRPFDENGNWMPKTQKEYLCRRGCETAAFTASEFKKAKAEGWEKMYQYWRGKEKLWLTPSEAYVENLVRVSKNPRSTLYGRRDQKMEFWNSPEALVQYRKAWETHVNQALEAAGRPERVDCRSYEAQGKETVSGIHLGPYAAKDTGSTAYRINEEIKDLNQKNEVIQETLHRLEQQLAKKQAGFYETLAEQLGKLESSLAAARYSLEECSTWQAQLQKDLEMRSASLERIRQAEAAMQEKDQVSRERIARLQAGRERGAFTKTPSAIQEEEDAMQFRRQRFAKILEEEGFPDGQALEEARRMLSQMELQIKALTEAIRSYKENIQESTRQYEAFCQYLPKEKAGMEQFQKRRQHWSRQYTQKAADHLRISVPVFRESVFRRAVQETGEALHHAFYLAGRTRHLLYQMEDFADREFGDGRSR